MVDNLLRQNASKIEWCVNIQFGMVLKCVIVMWKVKITWIEYQCPQGGSRRYGPHNVPFPAFPSCHIDLLCVCFYSSCYNNREGNYERRWHEGLNPARKQEQGLSEVLSDMMAFRGSVEDCPRKKTSTFNHLTHHWK